MMKRKMLLKFLTTLLAFALLTLPLAACDKEEQQPDGKQSASAMLKIMTFNVLNGWNTSNIGNRDDETAKKILEHAPDVLDLQEFDDYYRNATGTLSPR